MLGHKVAATQYTSRAISRMFVAKRLKGRLWRAFTTDTELREAKPARNRCWWFDGRTPASQAHQGVVAKGRGCASGRPAWQAPIGDLVRGCLMMRFI